MRKLSVLIISSTILLFGCGNQESNASEESSTEVVTEQTPDIVDNINESGLDQMEESTTEYSTEEPVGTYKNSTPEELMETFFKGVMDKDIMVVGNLYSGEEGTPDEIMAFFAEEFKDYTYEDFTFELYEEEYGITAADLNVDGSTVLIVEMENTDIGYMVKDF